MGTELRVSSFGEKLRREREMRSITLEEIAEATKIGSRNLKALEEENFDILPGGIFNKGFVRAYARYLGIDEDEAVADYVAAASDKLSTTKLEGGGVPQPEQLRRPPGERKSGMSAGFWAFACALLLLALSLGGWKKIGKFRAERFGHATVAAGVKLPDIKPAETIVQPQPTPAPATDTLQPTQAPATDASVTTPAAVSSAPVDPVAASPVAVKLPPMKPAVERPLEVKPPNAAPAEFVVQVHVTKDSYVQLSADGKVTTDRMLNPGMDREIRASKEVKIVTYNAGGIEVVLNGKKLDPLGPEGQRREITLTANGVQQ